MPRKLIMAALAAFIAWPALAVDLAPMAEDALAPLTRENNLKAFEIWRRSGIRRIESIRKAAANHLRRDPECKMLNYVGFAVEKSDYPAKIIVYGDCAGRERIYLTESQARALR